MPTYFMCNYLYKIQLFNTSSVLRESNRQEKSVGFCVTLLPPPAKGLTPEVLEAGKGIPEKCLNKLFRPEQKAILVSGHSESEDVLKSHTPYLIWALP